MLSNEGEVSLTPAAMGRAGEVSDSAAEDSVKKDHIMISYQWDYQELILRVCPS